ncbi:hypothetical protein INT47_003899 [Mucor saturninus]|uniref:Uncharacterized protein n=1 Tax=Mucor saturninus TaxID=64648 RepID=A0A8H7R1M4_9FUNG|nr:hypothetical protein INT47_003899 [Mucor saturninus]
MEFLRKFHHSQDQEAETTTPIEGNQSCTDSDTEVDNDDAVGVILDTDVITPLPTAQEAVKEIYSRRDYTATDLSAVDQTTLNWITNVRFFLNNSWSLNPIATHIASKILEEMIFVGDRKALLVLCGEIYGRLPTLDAHHEKTSITKGNCPQSSLPHVDTRYPNVELCLMYVDNSQKLVLGTKTMNVLITSSIRIDCNEKPVVGPSS